MTENTRKDKDPTGRRGRKVFKGNTDLSEESNEEKYCPFHDAKGHNLPECKAFARKTLQERTQWLKLAGLCFRCLMQKHLARDCKAVVECTKCVSDRHLETLHMERKKKKEEDEELKAGRTNVSHRSIDGVSCSKIVLLNISHPERPQKVIKAYA